MTTTTKFITLGTAGGPVPKLHRAAPAHAVLRGDRTILVDCGEGAMRQLMRAGIDFRQVHDVFLTHHHFDHIGSLFACLGINMMLQRKAPLKIYGPPGTLQIIDALSLACDVPCDIGFGVSGQKLPHPREFVQVHEISPGDVVSIDDIKISCCENTHFRSEDKFGQEGPVSLSFRFDAPDRSIVLTGDTGPCQALEGFAKCADLLVGELMDVDGVMDGVRRKNPHMSAERIEMMGKHMADHHLTPKELAALASRVGVAHVVAVHIPLDSITPETAPDIISEMSATFGGKISVANDLERF
jgi:ribonuclease BN (tRNA processing enzyme)